MPQTIQNKKKATRLNGEITRKKILNAAEELFGKRGFATVSLREITTQAGVTLALVSYHFVTKEKLFEAVVSRRAAILCVERRKRLATIQTHTVRTIMDAFMAPLFERASPGETGWLSYFRVVAQLADGDQWLHLLSENFDETAREFMFALTAVLPDVDPDEVARAFNMSLQVMLATASQNSRIDSLTAGKLRGDELSFAYPALLDFVTAGIVRLKRQ